MSFQTMELVLCHLRLGGVRVLQGWSVGSVQSQGSGCRVDHQLRYLAELVESQVIRKGVGQVGGCRGDGCRAHWTVQLRIPGSMGAAGSLLSEEVGG